MEYEDEERREFYCRYELLNSVDGKTVTLVVRADEELSPTDFAEALRTFADRMDAISSMADADPNLVM